MNFKELVEADRDIFINIDEFGSQHDIDGAMIDVVLEDEQIEGKDETQALSQSVLTLFARTEELPTRKQRGETLYVDDVGYLVVAWLEEMGVTKVALEYPESW